MVSPLPERLRPSCIDEIIGQDHIFGENKILPKLISSGNIPNMIFYGPPGTGKTSAAKIISKKSNKKFLKINATTASSNDIKQIISETNPIISPNGILLYIDEIQYFNKKQQQSLLEYVENGKITLIASTTENPYFYIYGALLSRCHVFEFKSIPHKEIKKGIAKSINFLEKENNIKISADDIIIEKISTICGGDMRKAINILEIYFMSKFQSNKKIIKLEYDDIFKEIEKNPIYSYNKNGDEHFDLISALQKSLRGSDPQASIYYLARLLDCGELISACRRILVCACEDVGLAYPSLPTQIKALTDIAIQVGLPEAHIPLANAVILIALSPKSNSAYKAINNAFDDIKKGNVFSPPRHLKNIHCDSEQETNLTEYQYPHQYKNHYINQQYLPDEIKNKQYYYPQENKNEISFKNHWEKTTNKKL